MLDAISTLELLPVFALPLGIIVYFSIIKLTKQQNKPEVEHE